jgi:hypothetical protein
MKNSKKNNIFSKYVPRIYKITDPTLIEKAKNLADVTNINFFKASYGGRLGGVVVSVLATGPKSCRFEPSQGDGFLRAIKICCTPSSRMGSKAGRSHVIRFYGI